MDCLHCHHVNICPGGAGHGEKLRRGGPLQVLILVRSGPRHTRRPHHDGRGVWRADHPRPVHLRGGHHHLPQPDLVGVLVLREHRRASRGAGGRRGQDEAEEPQAEPGGEARVQPSLQQDQGLFEKGRPEQQQPYKRRYRDGTLHYLQHHHPVPISRNNERHTISMNQPSTDCK